MDLANIRKKIDDEMLTYQIQKGITQFRNAAKNQEIDRDVATSDFFKTLREPLIEQQKKTDEKQDKMIKQLEKNQKAIENALDFQQLPQLPGVEKKKELLPLMEESPLVSTGKIKEVFIDMNEPFNEYEMAVLKDYEQEGLVPLNELVGKPLDIIEEARKKYIRVRRKFVSTPKKNLADLVKKGEASEEEKRALDELQTKGEILSKYYTRTSQLIKGDEIIVKKGKGQPKRHAYKIQDKHFGKLMIDVPKLMNEMKLDAFRGGNLVYQADADRSLIDLLTERFNPKKPVSINAARIFNDLVMLANLSKHPSSGKSRLIGSSIIAYSKPEDLIKRNDILLGAMAAGNTSHVIANDLSMVNDELLKIGAIDRDMHRKFYEKYLK